MIVAISILIATAIPILSLWLIHSLDKFKTGEFKFVLFSAGAGLLAYQAAAWINPIPRNMGWVDYNQMVRFVAPVVEEILKALLLLFLVRRPKFNYFVDGAIYGFTTGIGFAVIENIEYILANPNMALMTAITRVISTNLMHAASCATVGIVLGWARFQKPAPRWLYSFGGIMLAIMLHMGYNNLVTRVTGLVVLIYAVIIGGGAAVLIAFMIRRGLKQEGGWIQETLGLADRVEHTEVAAVQNIGKIDKVLARLEVILGSEVAKKISELVYLQARLGIWRKQAEMMADEKMRASLVAQIEQARIDMEKIRRSIGSYGMMYLRYTHLEETVSVYGMLEARIQEQAAQPRGPGMGVFDRLKGVVPSAKNDGKSEE
ncbi:PrsW family intramembrane metalloprotease [bacterium]|nr:PrsW family intramembrane metalloprotease [bacterium]